MAILVELQSFLQSRPILLILISLLLCSWFYYHLHLCRKHEKMHSSIPTNWPVFGMLPAVIQNAHRLHDYGTEVLIESGGNFEFKGPWFANVDMVVTCEPANIHYILSKNFSNYPKGPEFRKIFDILGDGIFNTDSELWEIHRKVTLSTMHHPDFQKLLEETVLAKVEEGLLPILENYANRAAPMDLQDILQRLTFDIFSRLILDHDPASLSLDLPNIPSLYAFLDAEEALLQRHILPESCWKLQKWLGFGKERKLSEAWEVLDQYIYPCIDKKQQLLLASTATATKQAGEMNHQFDGLTAFIEAYKATCSLSSSITSVAITKLFVRDVMLSLIIAGRDTISTALSWFFFLLAKNPSVEAKILQEIQTKLGFQRPRNQPICNLNESQKLVYLHGALCETLRLFPPVALEHKAAVKADILPSGVCINGNTKVLLFFYSMGRMESVWGKDCLEFKPERWISERGRIRHEPSFNFPAFNAGPRTCLGKEIAFVLMKMVAASIIYNYHVQLLEDHEVTPCDSVIIQMKHGLKVKICKRI